MKAPTKPTYTELEQRCRELERGEAQCRDLLVGLPIGVLRYAPGPKGEIVMANEAIATMLGYDSVEEFLQSDVCRKPGGRGSLLSQLNGVDSVETVELRLQKRNGSFLPVVVTARDATNAKGEIAWKDAIIEDVSNRHRDREERNTALSLLDAALESTEDGLLVVNLSGKVTKFNRKFLELWRLPDELVFQDDDESFLKVAMEQLADPEGFLSRVKELYNHPRKTSFDVVTFTDGRIFERYSQPQRLGSKIVGRVWSFRDVTLRKRAETALRESETRFRELFNSISDLVYTQDLKGRLISMNAALCKAFGYTQEELVGRRVSEFMKPEFADMFESEYLKRLKTSGHHEGIGVYFTKEGTQIYLEYRSSMVYPEEGEPYISGTGRDVTARILAEKEKQKLQEQLIQSQKLESVGRLAGGVAHDFNNMLSVILGYSQSAMDELEPDGAIHRNLQEVVRAAKRSAELTKQLLTFARKQIIEPKLLDLNEAVGNTMSMLHRLIGEAIDLVWRPADHLWPVKMDPSQVDQILANLCVNAKDAIFDVGRITIETGMKSFDLPFCTQHPGFMPGDYVMLAVSDTGHGMDQETLVNLFEPFFTTKELGKGTGLGLATTYGIVKQNNGFIDVHSKPGEGSSFRIYLPRCDPETDTASPTPFFETPTPTGDETILLVEDEPAILNMVAMMLERRGYIVLTAATPVEALRLADSFPGDIHLLMTDVIMPEMNGQDLARRVHAQFPKLKCLFMSGYAANVIANHDVMKPGVHFIQKPFSISALAAKVREALDETEGSGPQA